jgi:hypothetical protein
MYANGLRQASSVIEGPSSLTLNWDNLRETKGTYYSGPTFSDEVEKLDGVGVYVTGYASGATTGKYSRASLFSGLLPSLVYGQDGHNHSAATSSASAHDGHNHSAATSLAFALLTPLPMRCYWWRNPPMNEVIFVEIQHGDISNIRPESPGGFRGKLVLHKNDDGSEGGRFFYVLEDATFINLNPQQSQGQQPH